MSMTLDLVLALGQDDADVSTPCRSYDADLWFAERPDDVALAQELCGGCALRTACLASVSREPEDCRRHAETFTWERCAKSILDVF